MNCMTRTHAIAHRSIAVAISAMLAAGSIPATALAEGANNAEAIVIANAADGASDYDRASLADGTYDLSVALNRADAPDTASMAGASVDGAAKLVVDAGSYSVQVTLKTMTVMGIVGDITKMAYYPGGYVADGVAYFQGQTQAADVLSTRESEGTTCPAVVSIPLSAAMISDGHVLVAITTTGMSGADGGPATVQGVLKLDWDAFDNQYGPADEQVNRSALSAQIDAAKAIVRGQAATVDWNLLQNEIAQAQGVLADGDATQSAIDAETATLSSAVDRFSGKCSLTCRDGYFYLMGGTWVQESAQASGASAFFASSVEVRLANDDNGRYSIRITPNNVEGASVAGVTYAQGTEAQKVTTTSATESQKTTEQYELFADSLTSAIRVDYTLSVNGSVLKQFGYLVLDYAGASEVVDTTPSPAPDPEPAEKPVERLAGETRYETMAAISAEAFDSADSVVIASGEDFPDALGASALAGVLGAPVLLTGKSQLNEAAAAEIERLGASKAYVVGGEAAVSPAVADGISALGVEVDRIAGATRQGTAAAVAQRVAGASAPKTAIVASGKAAWDSLSASPYAYAEGCPIYLAEGDGSLGEDTLAAIRAAGSVGRVVIVGGESAVSPTAEAALEGLGLAVERWSGATRYETSLAIAQHAVTEGALTPAAVGVASGERFPDALAGGALLGSRKSVLLLSATNGEDAVAQWISERKDEVEKAYLLGGESALSDAAERQMKASLQ